jgi:hypothetical protein
MEVDMLLHEHLHEEVQDIDIAEADAERHSKPSPMAGAIERAEAAADREAESAEELEAHLGDEPPEDPA